MSPCSQRRTTMLCQWKGVRDRSSLETTPEEDTEKEKEKERERVRERERESESESEREIRKKKKVVIRHLIPKSKHETFLLSSLLQTETSMM